MATVSLYSQKGSEIGKIELPEIFNEEIREDLIRRAVLSEESELLQPKGTFKMAGMQTSARYIGRKDAYHSLKNRGIARLPREMYPKGRIGRVRIVPFSVKGRRAHPPKVEKVLIERINKKEKKKALISAIAATARKDLVSKKHILPNKDIPIVLDDECESLAKTKDVVKLFDAIGLLKDIERAKERRKRNNGRKGGVKVPNSILLVLEKESKLAKAARNLPGVNVTTLDSLKVSDLAPGGVPGRLTVWTKSAIQNLSKL
ncbi:MAG: 50S ribosomal protein L4 [Candidatus Micrarchaeota archaeon]|nr:50S ribosomal protein L4 [Candidatus Micrarchaeota archaeon]